MSESSFDSGISMNDALSSSTGEFSSENYSEELDRVLQRYEEAARRERFYLLQFSFQLKNSPFTIDCGLSPARSFCPIIRLRMQTSEITFNSYEWSEFVNALKTLQDEFFKKSNVELEIDDYLPFFCDGFQSISMSKVVYDGNVKQVMVMKHLSMLYLDENDAEEILNIPLISHRLSLLEELNFCLYYYNTLNTLRQTIINSKNVSIIELLNSFCNSEGNTLLSNALRDYVYYYKDSILYDFNKGI